MSLVVASVPNRDLAMTNKLYVNPEDYNSFGGTAGGQVYIQIKEYVFSIE